MADKSDKGCGCAVVLGLFFGLPLTMLLAAPAIAARIWFSGVPALAGYLPDWVWASSVSPVLALLMVRAVLSGEGRVRSRPAGKRWLGIAAWSLAVLAVVNTAVFVQLTRAGRTDHVIANGMPLLLLAAGAGVVTLVAISAFDRRPRPVTVEEVRAAVTEADRALRRVRAENARVRRQAEQVQARVGRLRAQGPGSAGHPRREGPAGHAGAGHTGPSQPDRSDLDFRALRTFHRESYGCADTAHMAYQSAQVSLRTMSSVVRRAQAGTRLRLPATRAARAARVEMRAAAEHLARAHGELRTHVDQGLGMVRGLNANTSDLKHEIRDNCGTPGRQWFEALEERVAEARSQRRAGRAG